MNKKRYYFVFVLSAVLMFTACTLDEDIFVMRANAGLGLVVTKAGDWNKAIQIIKDNDVPPIITVKGDMPLPGNSIIFKNITVTINGKGRLYLTSGGTIFTISERSTVTIDSADLIFEGLTLSQNGFSNNAFPLISVDGGTLKLQNGTIRNNTCMPNGGSGSGGGVYVDGTFIMTGGTISGNTAKYGGGVYISSGRFTMSGGTISGNTADGGSGGGVYNYGSFTMSGGTIRSNKADSELGGGVLSNGTFTMTGGTISGNTAWLGGGVYTYTGTYGANFTKAGGGIIYGNDAPTQTDRNIAASGGHAVYWYSSSEKVRNTTLGESDNISTNNSSVGWGL